MIEAARQTTQFGGPVWTLAQQARLYAALDQLDKAHEVLELAREAAADPPYGLSPVWLGIAEAQIAMIEGKRSLAAKLYERTSEAAAKSGLRWHRTQATRAWTEVLIEDGEPESGRSRDLLEQARREFKAMGARIYAERLAARLTELAGEGTE